MRRSGPMMAAVLIAALVSVPGAAGAKSPSKSPTPKGNVWYGVEEYFADSTNSGVQDNPIHDCGSVKYHYTIRFRFVEDPKFGHGAEHRYSSMSINWSGSGHAYTAGYREQTCGGSGGVEARGAWTKANEKAWGAKFPCKTTDLSNNFVMTCGAMPSIDFPRAAEMYQLRDGCSYSEEHPGHTRSVWLAPQTDAVMKVKTDKSGPDNQYWNFVPEPGATISFLVKSNIPSLFRFTLEDVSKLPGYAMNAKVDHSFFALFPSLQHLKGQYQNDSPDLIFDPANYRDRALWKAPSFGEVETAKFGSAATVIVTAMDYGAYGHLHAYIKGICGGWMPVTIKWEPAATNKSEQSGVTIPLDQDGNLIADRMGQPNNGITKWGYAGDPGRDDDPDPKGDGVAGDGLTAFEEYRGFMIKSGDCSNPLKVTHIRTDPKHKDLFIRSDDPLMERLVTMFSRVSGLQVHLLCPRQYQGDNTRVVNFTLHSGQLQSAGASVELEGKTISQDAPQHGVYLSNQSLDGGILGATSGLGPPRRVEVVKIDKAKCMRVGGVKGPIVLAYTIFHELGHSIGIEHHGDGNIQGPVIIVNAPVCPNGSVAGSVAGAKACKAGWIAIRKQQNSGEQSCPMKYIWWAWYVPSSASLTSVGNGNVTFQSRSNEFGHIVNNNESLPAYTGRLMPYLTDRDSPGLSEFCASQKGTGINALPEDRKSVV